MSIVFGPGFFGNGGEEPIFAESIALSMDEGRAYSAGSPTGLDWLSRPLSPGPVGTPYLHHSTTAWTFRSAAPSDPSVSRERIPLLVVDYGRPLDDLNRPTGRVVTFTIHQVTGTASRPVTSLQVDTSSDGGTTSRSATAQPQGGGRYRVALPRVSAGTAVNLRVDATDRDGNRIEQTLFDAHTT